MAVLLMAFAGSWTWRCSSWLLCAGDGELLINYGILTIWSVTRASFLGGVGFALLLIRKLQPGRLPGLRSRCGPVAYALFDQYEGTRRQ